MKKNLILGMFAAAGLLLAGSCQKDNLAPAAQAGDEAVVTFSLVQSGISTRAVYSDGLTATTLTYAVYDADADEGEIVPLIVSEDQVTFDNLTATVSLRLVTGKSYDVIFWADAPVEEGATNPYTFDSATQTISVNYTGIDSQDESRDAFYAHESFTVSGTVNKTVELRRPFAQLNIGTTDYDASSEVGFTAVNTAVKVSEVYSTLNLLSDEVEGTAESVSFATAAIPEGETFPIDDVKYLAMNYLLVAVDKALVDVEFSVDNGETAGEAAQTIVSDYTNVPVQRNYRTNIYGDLLTNPADFTVVITPEYIPDTDEDEDDYAYPSTSEEALLVAAANGGTVTLTEDVTLTEPIYIAAGKSVVIDLNGQTISAPSGYDRTLQVNEGAELVINGDGVVGSLDSGALAVAVNGGTLTINGGTFYGGPQCSCIYMFKYVDGTIVINGGYFAVAESANYGKEWFYVLNLQNGAAGTISVTGGTFENYDPALGDDNTGGNFVAEGYQSIQISEEPSPYGTYMVVPESVTAIATSTESLTSALESAASSEEAAEILLLEGETYTLSEISADNVTIDGNGATIVATNGTLAVSSDNVTISSVTVEGDGDTTAGSTINITGSNTTLTDVTFTNGRYNTWAADVIITVSDSESVITVENCDFRQSAFRGFLIYSLSGTLIIDNCLFDNTYPFNVNLDSDTGNIQVSNSSLNGWTSYAYLEGGVSFTDCSFGRSTSGYAFCRPYSNTTFTGCEFISDYRVGCGRDGITVDFSGCTWSEDGSALTDTIISTSEFENHSGSTYSIQ